MSDVIRGWHDNPDAALACLRPYVRYHDEKRATGALPLSLPWVAELRGKVVATLGGRYDVVCFQGYRDGEAACEWHTDAGYVQAILSLGAARRFGIRDETGERYVVVEPGDLAVVYGEHCVPRDDVAGERCSIVFRDSL